MAKIVVYMETNKIGSRCIEEIEIGDEELEELKAMSEEDYDRAMEEFADDYMYDLGEYGAYLDDQT